MTPNKLAVYFVADMVAPRPLSRIPYHGSGDRETRLGLPGEYDSRSLECRETVRPTWPDHGAAAAAQRCWCIWLS